MADDAPNWDDLSPQAPQQNAAPEAPAQSAPNSETPDWDSLSADKPKERSWGEELGRDLRTFARGVIPTTAGVVGGIGSGALASEAGPLAIPIGLAGGIASSAAAQTAQDKITDALGIDSPESRAADAANPNVGSRIAEFAPAAVTLGTGGLSATLAQRLGSGALMGALDVGQQALTKGEVDPTEAAVAAGSGALFTQPRGWVPGAGHAMGAFGDVKKTPAADAPEGKAPAEPDIVAGQTPDTTTRSDANTNAGEQTELQRSIYHSADSGNMPANTLGTAVSQAQPDGYHRDYTGGLEAKPDEGFQAGTGDIGRDQGKRSLSAPEGVEGATDNPGIERIEPGMPGPAAKAALGASPEVGDRDLMTGRPGDALQTPRPEALMPRAPIGPNQPFSPADPTMKYQWPDAKPRVRVPAESREVPPEGAPERAPTPEAPPQKGANDDLIRSVLQEIEANPNAHIEALDGPREQFGQRETALGPTAEQPGAEPVQQPKPQNLSAGAPGEARTFASAPEADRISRVSKLGDAIKNFADPKWFKQAFAPELINQDTRNLDSVIREGQGTTNRERAQLEHNTKELERAINNTPAATREEYVDTFQRGVPKSNELSRLAPEALKAERSYQDRFAQQDPDGNFQSRWLPQMFADKEGAQNFAIDWRENHTGTPTIGDFRKAGFQLDPKFNRQDGSVDPMKVKTDLYGAYDRFLEGRRITQRAVDDGLVFQQRVPGTQPLTGLSHGGQQLYATPEIATMWDRYFAPGAQDVTSKSAINTAQKIKNATTAFQLIGGGYHLVAETGETFIGDLMRAVSHAAAGDLGKAAEITAKSPTAPYRSFKRGGDVLKGYLDPSKVPPEMAKAIDYMTKAGLTAERIQRYTPESGTVRGFFEAADKAAAKLELGELAQQARKGPIGAGKSAFQLAGKAMQTVMEPLFNHYIPRLKLGVAYEQFADYIAANPGKSDKQYTDVAKRILKSVDDRLGEMNQSTLYWNNTLKRAANLLMISPGWETGTIRAAIGGTGKLLTNPRSMSIKNDDFHPNAAWPIAFALGTAAFGSMYQFLKTGKPPEDAKDPFFPKTGGTVDGKPERAILPGYLKDIHGWWDAATNNKGITRNASSMAYNKLAAAPRAVWDTLANKDWAGKQIYNPNDPLHKKLADYFHYLQSSFSPIMTKQIAGSNNPKSGISTPERAVGIRAAGSAIQNPAKAQRNTKYYNQKEAEEAARFRKKYPQ